MRESRTAERKNIPGLSSGTCYPYLHDCASCTLAVAAATAIHFLEEWLGFADWAQRNISSRYTRSNWRRVHGMGMLLTLTATAAIAGWTSPAAAFLFPSLFLAPTVFNSLFHLASSAYFRSYSPGTASASLTSQVLCWYFVSRFAEAGLLDAAAAAAADSIGRGLSRDRSRCDDFFFHCRYRQA